jgi:hypothetical protein
MMHYRRDLPVSVLFFGRFLDQSYVRKRETVKIEKEKPEVVLEQFNASANMW